MKHLFVFVAFLAISLQMQATQIFTDSSHYVRMTDYATEEDGYWLFEPVGYVRSSAPIIVFNHGYGGYNPYIYGAWIEHLVVAGNIVVFPRYQKNIFFPAPTKFADNAAKAICNAIDILDGKHHMKYNGAPLILIGHSYGGAISAELMAAAQSYGIPQPIAALMAAPGTGPFKGGKFDSYAAIPPASRLIVVTHEDDYVVGSELGETIYNTAAQVYKRIRLHTKQQMVQGTMITAGHNESYALNEAYDGGIWSVTSKRAFLIGKTDVLDTKGYWNWADQLIAAARGDEAADQWLFSGDTEKCSLGFWEDGKPLEVVELHWEAKAMEAACTQ